MLAAVDKINNLSDGLREYLQKEWDKLPERIVYKFNISNPNPDPEKYNGPIIWPSVFKLPQVRFTMNDPFTQPLRQITVGMVAAVDDKGVPNKFGKIQVLGAERGVLQLSKSNVDDQDRFAYIELHPRFAGNKWRDKNQLPIVVRVDEEKESIENRMRRKVKVDAMAVAADLRDEEVKNFAAALSWDENEPMPVLRDRLEKLAEEEYVYFTELFNSGNLEYRFTMKRALDNHIVVWMPLESKLIWASNQETIVTLPFAEDTDKSEVQRLGEWMATSGKKGDETYSKLKLLLKARK